jgi:hypothetical protein
VDIAIVVENNFSSTNPPPPFVFDGNENPFYVEAWGGGGRRYILLYRGKNRVRILFFFIF